MNIDPALLARTYRDPIALTFLVVDLLPIFAVLFLGWGAVELVFLYWLENLVIGLMTIARMLAVGTLNRDESLPGAVGLSAFFTVHYGMFCFVHGVFLVTFAELSAGGDGGAGFDTPVGVIGFAMGSADAMAGFITLILAANIAAFVADDIFRGEAATSSLQAEMMSPYGRIIVLHVGIFAGAFALMALGEPMIGVLALILLRVAWGVFLSILRRRRLDQNSAQS